MRQRFQVACLQLGSLEGDPGARREAVARLVQETAADLIVLPELWPVGYFAFDDYSAAAEPLHGPTLAVLADAAKAACSYVVVGSFVERSSEGMHNTTAVLDPNGHLLGSYRKIHVFGYGSRETELVAGGEVPVVVDTELGRLGLAICYDLRFPELFRNMVDSGADAFVVPAAWPQARTEHWRLFIRARAIENQTYAIACNGCGAPNGTALAGHSAIIDPWGETVAEAAADPARLTGTVERERLNSCREEFPALADRRLNRPDRVAA